MCDTPPCMSSLHWRKNGLPLSWQAKLCKERHIAINKLAAMSDVKQSTLDNIVRGLTKNPRDITLHKIALAFNMTLAEFLNFDELNDYAFDEGDE